MKAFALFVLVSVFIPLVVSYTNIWNSVPGNSDEEKAGFLFVGVATARSWLASQLCTSQYFQSPLPTDYTTNQNWGGFLCTEWGGPAGTFANCSYYYQNSRTNDSLQTVGSSLAGLMKSVHFYSNGLGYNLNDIQFNMTRDALVQAIYVAGTGTGAFQLAATADLETLRSSIVSSSTVACPTAAHQITWPQTSAGSTSVNVGDYVQWTWSDASPHSVAYVSGGGTGFALPGFGAGNNILSRSTSCTASGIQSTSPCVLEGNGAFSYSYQFTTPCQTITLQDGNGGSGTPLETVVVGPAANSSCSVATTSGFVGSTTTTTGGGDGSATGGQTTTAGSGAKLVSWMGMF